MTDESGSGSPNDSESTRPNDVERARPDGGQNSDSPDEADGGSSDAGGSDANAPDGERFAREISDDVDSASGVLGHFYRGEMDRVNNWRSRLDQTTNWAVTIMAAILTFVFSSQDNPHYLVLIAVLTVVVFVAIDTRRYRAYDVWRARIRLVEEDVFAPVIDPETETEHDGWRGELSRDLRRPAFKTPLGEALGRRLRRVYLPLLLVLLAAWLARVTVFAPNETALETASVLSVPGWAVFGAVGLVYGACAAIAFWPRERQAKGEIYHRGKEGEWKDGEWKEGE